MATRKKHTQTQTNKQTDTKTPQNISSCIPGPAGHSVAMEGMGRLGHKQPENVYIYIVIKNKAAFSSDSPSPEPGPAN